MDIARLGQVITPDVPAAGKGYRALYSERNLIEMRLVQTLGHFGIPQKRTQRFIEALRTSHHQWLDLDGKDGYVLLTDQFEWGAGETMELALMSLSKHGTPTGFVAINLAKMKRAIRRNIEQNTFDIEGVTV